MKARRKSPVNQAVELIVIVAVAVGLAIAIQAFLVKPYRIPSGSMMPTLAVGQRVLVDRIGNRFSDPAIGDIVVFHPPQDYNSCAAPEHPNDGQACDTAQAHHSSVNFIKRVVGLPGDRLVIRDGHVYRNGHREKDPYIAPCGTNQVCNLTKPIVVPKGEYFMMGDNRGLSDDSRFWGPVPRSWIIGDAFATYWPLSRIGLL